MHPLSTSLLMILAGTLALTQGKCESGCDVPTLIYDDLKCSPKYESPNDCCPKEYDCSHIYNRAAGTCHLKGKIYNPGEEPDEEDVAGFCMPACRCTSSSEFKCPQLSDGCAEYWVGGYPKPGCYLKYELNQCCAAGQLCPPFEDNINCEVNGVTYKEGLKFDHPTQKCTQCVCQKGFEDKFEAPFCQKLNCTEEMKNPKNINNFCAPFYKSSDSCCPDHWICPSDNDKYISATTKTPNPDLHCKFGTKLVNIGDKFVRNEKDVGEVTCECLIPPYLTCALPSS